MSDVYTLVTEKITAALEAGTVPWQRPWTVPGSMPRNLVSKRPYRGMNRILLALGEPYASPWWLTFRQAKALGGHVRAGEKAALVTFWKRPEPHTPSEDRDEDATERDRRAPLLRHYHVFNVAQCEGIAVPPLEDIVPTAHERLDWCEQLLSGMQHPPEIRDGYDRAFYSPTVDLVGMPRLALFRSAEDYYATLFHELTHATGHPSRLDRELLGTPAPFGSPDYSREELVAELGAAFLCGHAGIFPRVAENQAAYLAGWIKVLKGDKRLLPIAASQAQRAADFILGTHAAAEAEEEDETTPALARAA
jgi:antirestriction protein ArdC